MALRIHKAGLLDTLQDAGRYGFQHLGINPAGVMDRVAMKTANTLVGNAADEAVLEMYFPAAEILFEEPALIALAGGDFGAEINGESVPALHPLWVQKGALLQFRKKKSGAVICLAVHKGFMGDEWLHSMSTHLFVKAGGYKGRALQKNDLLLLKKPFLFPATDKAFTVCNWFANTDSLYDSGKIRFIPGNEYHLLNEASKKYLIDEPFMIQQQSNRMGFRLQGKGLQLSEPGEMISSAVTRGTIQLLPDGQLIVLMADHQTTGGYPRIAHITGVSLSALAQMTAGEKILFQKTDLAAAETALAQQERNLQQLQNACTFRLQDFLQKK